MRTWTRTLTLAALAALVACTEDAPETLAGPSHKEADAAQPDLGQIYAATRVPNPCYCRPIRVPPRFFRFESELAKQRFLAEVVGSPAPGKITGFRPVVAARPNFDPVFLDVRIRPGDQRIETELIGSRGQRGFSRTVWEPENGRREPGGIVWTH